MVKKFFLLLLVAMLNVVAWAEPVLQINPNDAHYDSDGECYNVPAGYAKFTEPTVRVMDGTTDKTHLYNITYSILASDGTTVGYEKTDTRGVRLVVDADNADDHTRTETYVEKYYGDVVMGHSCTCFVKVTATPKVGAGTLDDTYKLVISAPTPTLTFTPSFGAKVNEDSFGSITLTTKLNAYRTGYEKAESLLPAYKITTTTNGITQDITDNFTINITYTEAGGTSWVSLNSAKTKLTFAVNASNPASKTGTLTYTFTPKSGYEDMYAAIPNKVIDVKFNVLGSEAKSDLSINLTREHFKQENVTYKDGAYTIHVYKYGKSDLAGSNNNYQYKTPTPSLVTADGTALPINGTNTGGGWNDFRFVYEIVEDNTYFDDCQYDYFLKSGDIQPAGEKTGLTIGEYMYQVAKPGLVKVRVWAVLNKDNSYGLPNKNMYNTYKDKGEDVIIKDAYGTEYIAYAAPKEFYIEVMKRQPEILMNPNPDDIQFVEGDVITMDKRFDVSAHMKAESNGIEGDLIYGAMDSNSDHFAYSFFISDRTEKNYISVTKWKDRIVTDRDGNVVLDGEGKPTIKPEWLAAGGDEHSYIDWFETVYEDSDGKSIQEGDAIKTGSVTFTASADYDVRNAVEVKGVAGNIIGKTVTVEGNTIFITPGNIDKLVGIKKGETVTLNTYTLVTSENKTELSKTHSNLDKGDYERGITYISMKGWGNEDWTMEFKQKGTYNIPYVARPWNHVRWDSSKTKSIRFDITDQPISTKIILSYYYKVVNISTATEKPEEKVVVPNWNNYDVTTEGSFAFSYAQVGDAPAGTSVNTTTGALTIGSNPGTITVRVSATGSATPKKYYDPSPVEYTIRIVDPSSLAKWEVISSCKAEPCDEHDTDPRFTDITDANGRMHFLTKTGYTTGSDAGAIYGGTLIEGVPGISMTVGAPAQEADADADWQAIATNESTLKCCDHETNSVVVRSTAVLTFDETNNVIPTAGTFYKFTPTVSGFLTIDAKLWENHTIVLIDGRSTDENEIDEIVRVADISPSDRATMVATGKTAFDGAGNTGNLLGDYTFKKPLIAGEEYYLYDVTGNETENLNLHGFSYTPAFIRDRNTTITESQAPISATTFKNGLSSDIPTILAPNASNNKVTFTVDDGAGTTVATPATYLEVGGHTGALTAKTMTMDGSGNIFKLRVKADVESTDATLGSCVTKTAYYYVSVLDIPTYIIGSNQADFDNFEPGKEVETTNIKTDLIMTFGGWKETADETDGKYDTSKSDKWSYKSKAGAHSRIGSELADNDLKYNKTIDGFEYFIAGNQNPVDEMNMGALQNATKKDGSANPLHNDGVYTYGTGTEYENSTTKFYNTTYRLPCRGAFLKFEPRKSGILMVYLVQTGSVDYHEGLTDVGESYQVKWRPLYITDETGRPVDMVNSFGDVSKLVPTGNDATQPGSFTLSVSRCGKLVPVVENAWNYAGAPAENKEPGCSFDWSQFKGNAHDRDHLLTAWKEKGERQSIIRLENGGFVLPHKGYVRYAFHVKAGKTYFVFQPGSKFEFGGYSFVPAGFPSTCKYTLSSTPASYEFNASNKEINASGASAATTEVTYETGTQTATDPQTLIDDKATTSRDIHFTWDTSSTRFTTAKENMVLTINDKRNSEIASDPTLTVRALNAGDWESICLPFSVSSREMKRVFGNDYVLVTCEGIVSNSDKRLHFVRHGNTYLEAGRPYLIKPSKNVTSLSFRNVSIEGDLFIKEWDDTNKEMVDGSVKKPTTARFDVNVNDGEYTFKGVYMRTTLPENSYIVQGTGSGNGLYRVGAAPAGSTYKIGGYRAFFYPESGSRSDSMLAYFVTDLTEGGQNDAGEITGVISIDADGGISKIPANSGVYTVSGQKVGDNPLKFNTAAPGLYIINGKKYIK